MTRRAQLTLGKLTTLATAGAILLASAALPARAASATTDAFLAAVRPNVDLLDRSSRLALDHSGSAAIRRFAHREAVEQTIAANSLVAWAQANTLAGAQVALGTTIPEPLAPVAVTPVPADASVAADGVLTGRSVATDGPEGRPLTVTRAPAARLVPPDADMLTRLAAEKGARFDALYRQAQHESLRQLSLVYADYMRTGDDPALRALATRELPKINRKLAELRRL